MEPSMGVAVVEEGEVTTNGWFQISITSLSGGHMGRGGRGDGYGGWGWGGWGGAEGAQWQHPGGQVGCL